MSEFVSALAQNVDRNVAEFMRVVAEINNPRIFGDLASHTIADLPDLFRAGFLWPDVRGGTPPSPAAAMRRSVAVVKQLSRNIQRNRKAYEFPLTVIVVFNMSGATLSDVVTLLEELWDGFRLARGRNPTRAEFTCGITTCSTMAVAAQWNATFGALPAVMRRHALTHIWELPPSAEITPASVLGNCSIVLALLRCAVPPDRIRTFLRSLDIGDQVIIGSVISQFKDAVRLRACIPAIIEHHAVLLAAQQDGVLSEYVSALIAYCDRGDPAEFLTSTAAMGMHHAKAYHELTTASSVAVRADAVRQRRGASITQYLTAYHAMCEDAPLAFESYVTLTEHWDDSDVLRTIWELFSDVSFLHEVSARGLQETLARASVGGVSAADIRAGGIQLLAFLTELPEDQLLTAAAAFRAADGNTARATAWCALPESIRNDPTAAVILRAHPSLMDAPNILGLALAVTRTGHVVSDELLRVFMEHGPWPYPRRFARVYGLALQYERAGYAASEAVTDACRVYDDLRPRARLRACRDSGWFQYHVLGMRSVQTAVSHAPRDRQSASAHAPQPMAPVNVADARGAAAFTIRTLHEHLDLTDCVVGDADAVAVSAIVAYGFFEPGKGVLFARQRYLPERHIRANLRRRYHGDVGAIERAWQWLESVGVIYAPTAKGGTRVLSLNLRCDGEPGRTVGRRVSEFVRWYRAQVFA